MGRRARATGFRGNVDPDTSELADIVGKYREPVLRICGLSSCHHKHFRGYIVVTKDGTVTNIGHRCGKTHFGVDFETLSRAYDREILDAERRDALHRLQNQADVYQGVIDQLKNESKGGAWINKQVGELRHPDTGLPAAIGKKLEQMIRTRSPVLKRERRATEREADAIRATMHVGRDDSPDDRKYGPMFIDEEVGTLDGLSILYQENDIRRLLIKDIHEGLIHVRSMPIDVATRHDLDHWSGWASEIDQKLNRCREIIEIGRQFFTRENISKFAEIAESAKDEAAVMALARKY